jgi:hypothetical protein
MGGSMSKRDRKRAARRRGRAERHKRARMLEARATLVYDPATAPDRAAQILHEAFGAGPVELLVAPTIAQRGGIDRARAVAEAALRTEPNAMALSLAADVALMDGRPADAEGHVVRALEVADDPYLHLRLVSSLASQGRRAEALEGVDAQLAEDPGQDEFLLARAHLLGQLHLAVETASDADRLALDRFSNRAPLRELQEAVGRFVAASPEWTEAFAVGLEQWEDAGAVTEEELEAWTDLAESDPGAREAGLLQLMGEWAWLAPLLEDEEEQDEDDDEDGEGAEPLLGAFASDPAVPPALRRRAEEWLGWTKWGLWEVARPEATPGVSVTDLVTGLQLYVEMPPAFLAGLPRWSVLLGQVFPVDGVWRAGDWFEVATPAEARELLHQLVDQLLAYAEDLGEEGRALGAWADDLHEEHLDALWLPGSATSPSPETMPIVQAWVRALFPGLVANLRRMHGERGDEPAARWYRLGLDDPGAAWTALAAQPAFELDDDDDLLWSSEPESAAGGHRHDLEDDDAPIWARASLTRDEDGIVVAPDSPDELAALLELLRSLGHPAAVVEEGEIDESVGPPAALPEDSDDLAAWLRAWADEPLAELDDHSPRGAVEEGWSSEVEALLRYLEHDADRRRLTGLATDALRGELGLEDDEEALGPQAS